MKLSKVKSSKLYTFVITLVVLGIVAYFLWTSMRPMVGEGYDGLRASRDVMGSELSYSIGQGVKTSWEKPVQLLQQFSGVPNFDNKMETVNGAGVPPSGSKDIWFLEDSKFSPECCPSVYSNSLGCICASKEVYNYLNQRGGNRTLTSEY